MRETKTFKARAEFVLRDGYVSRSELAGLYELLNETADRWGPFDDPGYISTVNVPRGHHRFNLGRRIALLIAFKLRM